MICKCRFSEWTQTWEFHSAACLSRTQWPGMVRDELFLLLNDPYYHISHYRLAVYCSCSIFATKIDNTPSQKCTSRKMPYSHKTMTMCTNYTYCNYDSYFRRNITFHMAYFVCFVWIWVLPYKNQRPFILYISSPTGQ